MTLFIAMLSKADKIMVERARMLLLIGAFLAGVITVFAPCVFALLPVIIGGSVSGDVHDKRRPFIIAASLAVSLIVFTLLLKATTIFITISPAVITGVSGGIIVALGIVLLFPTLYERLVVALNLQAKSQQLLGKSAGKGKILGAVITGAALGPVFSSCSPVYAYILATVLPVNFWVAMLYVVVYVAGLSAMLLLIGFFGQKLVRKLKWASNPHGWFNRIVAVLFIIVGLMVMTGYDKKFQTFVSENTPFDFDGLSSQLIPADQRQTMGGILNVQPYKAPEFKGIESWINSQPLSTQSLKGKVVLVDFWTYSCINCVRTQPYLKQWYERYKEYGFEIVGVHAPEFSFEQLRPNVERAAKEAGLSYPIALDNSFQTWRAYDNRYWPASYLVDREGNVRRTHFGEGEYRQTEDAIRHLLEQNGNKLPTHSMIAEQQTNSRDQSPETYLGVDVAKNYVGTTALVAGEQSYSPAQLGKTNQWTLGGTWTAAHEGITAVKDSVLRIRVAAKDVYMVTGTTTQASIEVKIDGKPAGQYGTEVQDSKLSVPLPRLYHVAHFDSFRKDALIELHVPAGVQLNTFTFGS